MAIHLVLLVGVAMTESRQVIQVPGAPPISIRFGARPVAPPRPSEPQQVQLHICHDHVKDLFCVIPLQAVNASRPVVCAAIP